MWESTGASVVPLQRPMDRALDTAGGDGRVGAPAALNLGGDFPDREVRIAVARQLRKLFRMRLPAPACFAAGRAFLTAARPQLGRASPREAFSLRQGSAQRTTP
jgi:hypothetical protein